MASVRRPQRKGGAPPLQPTVAEMRALAHPLRLRILEVFTEGPRTTKQVADLLGEPPTRLYHHVAALERARLLVLTGTRKNRGTTEKWYEAARAFGRMPAARGARRPKGSAARRAVAATVVELSRQELVLAMQQRGGERPMVARIVVTAQPKRLAALRKRLHRAVTDIQREFGGGPDRAARAGDARWAVTLTFAPASTSGSTRADAARVTTSRQR